MAGPCAREPAVACLIREAWEEAGLRIDSDQVEFVHAVHLADGNGDAPRMQLVFRARQWAGEPQVRDLDKCESWPWWPGNTLPEPLAPYTRVAIEAVQAGRLYTEMGRDQQHTGRAPESG